MITMTVTEFQTKLRDWQRAACEWLGLDPEVTVAITAVDDIGDEIPLSKADRDSGLYYGLRFQCVGDSRPSDPPRCAAGRWMATATGDAEWTTVTWHNIVQFTYDEAKDFRDTVGPEPKMFTEEEEARLRGLHR